VIATGFDRPNIRLEVEHHVEDHHERAAVLDAAATLPGPGLLYTATRKDAEHGRALTHAVNLLQQAAAITSASKGFTAVDDDIEGAVRRAVDIAQATERVDRTRVEMTRGYAETRDCRRQFLLGYFGEALHEPCGNCDRCDENAASGAPATVEESAVPVDTAVCHREWGRGVVISGDRDRITVLFDEYGYRTLAMSAVRDGGVLTISRR
jgi:ATP-dependent DNA helicase RecQ